MVVFPDPGGPEMYTVLLVKHKLVQRFSQFGEMLAQIYCLREVNVLLSSPPNFYCFSHVAAFGNSLVNFIERCRLECNLLPSKRERKNQYQQHEQHNAASNRSRRVWNIGFGCPRRPKSIVSTLLLVGKPFDCVLLMNLRRVGAGKGQKPRQIHSEGT